MNYQELLQDKRWKDKSKLIKERDRHVCQNCQNRKPLKEFEISELGLRNAKNGSLLLAGTLIESKYESRIKKIELGLHKALSFYGFLNNNERMPILLLSSDPDSKFFNHIGTFFLRKENYDFVETKKSIGFNFIGEEEQILNGYKRELYHKELKSKIINQLFSEIEWKELKLLHTHHKYYQKNKKPWEYPNQALITLCWQCHEELHENEVVPVYDEYMNRIDELKPCERCHGAGVFPEYSHIQGGICFECDGAKYQELIQN